MMKNILKTLSVLFFISYSVSSFSTATSMNQGKITQIYYYGTGMVLVLGPSYVDPSITATAGCNGSGSGFVIPHNYPKLDQLLSILLTANAAGKDVVVSNLNVPDSGCWAAEFTASSLIRLI